MADPPVAPAVKATESCWLVGVIASAFYLATAPMLASRFEMAGLVAANSLQLGAHTLIMLWLGWQRFGNVAFAGLLNTAGKAVAATAGMALVGGAAWLAVDRLTDSPGERGILGEFMLVAVPLVVCGLAYLVACRIVGLSELDDLRTAVQSRLRTGVVSPDSPDPGQ